MSNAKTCSKFFWGLETPDIWFDFMFHDSFKQKYSKENHISLIFGKMLFWLIDNGFRTIFETSGIIFAKYACKLFSRILVLSDIYICLGLHVDTRLQLWKHNFEVKCFFVNFTVWLHRVTS